MLKVGAVIEVNAEAGFDAPAPVVRLVVTAISIALGMLPGKSLHELAWTTPHGDRWEAVVPERGVTGRFKTKDDVVVKLIFTKGYFRKRQPPIHYHFRAGDWREMTLCAVGSSSTKAETES